MLKRNLLLLVCWLLLAGSAVAQDGWPQFRGAASSGVVESASDAAKLPDKWSQTENVVWKVDVPGTGWSSPIVWGNRIFVTSVISAGQTEAPKKGLYFGGERPLPTDEHRWMVYGIDFKTGKTVWQAEAFRGAPRTPHHLKNSYASETPVTDGERVYAYFGNLGLFAYDLTGKLLWKVMNEPRKTRFGWGTAASPVLYRDRLYIVNDNDEHSYLAAYDKKTGAQVWKVDREVGTNWATPYVWEHDGRAELIVPATKVTRSYSLDGKVLWEFKGMSSIAIPTPFSKFGLLYVTSGYVGDQNRPVYVIKPGASGDITLKAGETSSQFIAWYLPQAGPYNPSPIIYGDNYYTLFDRGFFTAHDARTGRELYSKQRIEPNISGFTASPWAYNGKIFCLSEDGDTYVIQAGSEYKLLGKNSLDELCMATPAIARGSLILRTATKLYRIGKA